MYNRKLKEVPKKKHSWTVLGTALKVRCESTLELHRIDVRDVLPRHCKESSEAPEASESHLLL